MNEELYDAQVELEREMRDRSISKFLKEHLEGDLSETITGSYLINNYILPVSKAIQGFLDAAGKGGAGRKNSAYKGLSMLEPEVSAFLFLKALLHRAPLYSRENITLSVTSLAVQAAGLLHDELRIRKFEADNPKLFEKIVGDFDKRELPRHKRKEYLQKVISDADEEWFVWSKADMLHVGVKLIDLFRSTTGDIQIRAVRQGRHKIDLVEPSDGLLNACERIRELKEDLTCTWYPMIIPPVPWSSENVSRGGYVSHHVTPYPLVKASKKAYRRLLQEKATAGDLDTVLTAVNAMQETPWRVNKRVLDALAYVYERNIECGKLPRADNLEPDPAPPGYELLAADDPRIKEYRRYRAIIHEQNRRSVGKRVLAIRAIHMAERFAEFERIYFPHDLDSRGRAYPKPNPLNPQGPDYVKGLLEFADGKPLGQSGLYWLGVHGANCFGQDKLPIDQRAAWARENIDDIRMVARAPKIYPWWTQADNPVQFLAFCFEYAEAFDNPTQFLSHLHVDLDATCSGLQHFSAMLRDEVGGYHVNMTPNKVRQDVYGAVAAEALLIFERDRASGGDRSGMADAWLKSAMMDRSVSKRPVMVKPYAGTLTSCLEYVRSAVDDKLKGGHALPWAKEDMFSFKLYGGQVVWEAIPRVVVAADGAMRWLSAVARAVGKSQPEEKRIEWTTPVGFPVWQYKFDMKSKQIETVLDGRRYAPSLVEETDRLDSRQMASATPPSFVHSMDGAHLQLTVARSVQAGLTHFALVHDSFGVHAADIPTFSRIIREAFVEMYQRDVLADFYESALPFISEKLREDIPPIPDKGNLDLQGILENEFFFS
nr:MAG TPA: DNA directed RNA polymerase [Caudoviricetes sp.]